MYSVLPPEKREELIIRRKVKLIKDFLRKRRKLEIAKENKMAHLKQLVDSRSIDKETYYRIEQLMILTHEQKRLDLVKAVIKKSFGIGKTSASYDNQPTEGN